MSTVLAGIAGILIAPLFSVSADMGTLFGIKAFAVAILGGLNSARGVVMAGFVFGVVEALITSMLGSRYTNILAFMLVIVALAIKPHGLFGTRRREKSMKRRARRCPRAARACWRSALAFAASANQYHLFLLIVGALTVIVGVGLNVLIGLSGQVSFGHVGFYALGAYVTAMLTTKLGWNFWLDAAGGGRARRASIGASARPGRAARQRPVSGDGDDRLRLRRRVHGAIEWEALTGGAERPDEHSVSVRSPAGRSASAGIAMSPCC